MKTLLVLILFVTRAAGTALADDAQPMTSRCTSPCRGQPIVAQVGSPNGPVLGPDLSKLDENKLLLAGHRAALHAIGSAGFHPELEPLIFVHGIKAAPKDLQTLADRLAPGPFQQYVLCYDDYHRRTSQNGVDLADELRKLAARLGPGRNVTIVAHSMGGIVVRRALNELAFGPGGGIEGLGRIRFIAIDTPWHGYGGPADTGASGFFMKVARPLLPAGLDDMRARSAMFQGDASATNPAARKGLLDALLPDNVEIELVFAKEGTTVLDYSKGSLRVLASKLADHFKNETSVSGNPQLMNEWMALLSSKDYFAFQNDMRDLAEQGKLDEVSTEAGLERHFPQFPGDHTGVLREHLGERSLLDHLSEELVGRPLTR